MKHFLLAMLLGVVWLWAQDSSIPHGSSDQLKTDLLQIEREAGRANFNCNYQYFDRLEAEEFVFTNANGEVTTKKQDLDGEKDCHKFDGSFDLDETQVHSRLAAESPTYLCGVTAAGRSWPDIRRIFPSTASNRCKTSLGHSSRLRAVYCSLWTKSSFRFRLAGQVSTSSHCPTAQFPVT
jgi:hypothetical protein